MRGASVSKGLTVKEAERRTDDSVLLSLGQQQSRCRDTVRGLREGHRQQDSKRV